MENLRAALRGHGRAAKSPGKKSYHFYKHASLNLTALLLPPDNFYR
jgi:hypothetical protein